MFSYSSKYGWSNFSETDFIEDIFVDHFLLFLLAFCWLVYNANKMFNDIFAGVYLFTINLRHISIIFI